MQVRAEELNGIGESPFEGKDARQCDVCAQNRKVKLPTEDLLAIQRKTCFDAQTVSSFRAIYRRRTDCLLTVPLWGTHNYYTNESLP